MSLLRLGVSLGLGSSCKEVVLEAPTSGNGKLHEYVLLYVDHDTEKVVD
jgi:hypothetical protein